MPASIVTLIFVMQYPTLISPLKGGTNCMVRGQFLPDPPLRGQVRFGFYCAVNGGGIACAGVRVLGTEGFSEKSLAFCGQICYNKM